MDSGGLNHVGVVGAELRPVLRKRLTLQRQRALEVAEAVVVPGQAVDPEEGQRVVVTDLRESTFYAELHLASNGRTHVVSSRPSDAIALAVRTGTTIFADESVLDEAGYSPDEGAEEEQDEVVEQFKEFIDRVNPEDFAS